MLSLLARSATTQKLSVYTQMVNAPFPGQQRHLIILDNGRSRIRNSRLKEALYCIRCGACLNSCPVFREIGGHAYGSPYSGPIGSVISAGFFGSDFVPLAQASSLCGACKEACPVDIDLPKLLTRVRAGQVPVSGDQSSVTHSSGLSPLGKVFMKMYSLIARNPRLFAISQKFAALGTRLVSPFSAYVPLPAFTGWGYSKDLPRFTGKTFRERFADLPVEIGGQVNRDTSIQGDNEESTQEPLADRDELVSRFAEELTKVSGKVISTNPHELTDKVIDFLKTRKISQIHLEPGALNEASLAKAGIMVSQAPNAALRVGVTPHVSMNWKETCGVTKAVCGLADTGSILIVDGEGNPLQASLLPSIHIAVLCASDILPSMADAMKLPIVSQSRTSVFITGPSRTADIEMSLTIGMHGPGEVHVFLVHTMC
jgi:L-lactate dehydrogenase complex protein LldF